MNLNNIITTELEEFYYYISDLQLISKVSYENLPLLISEVKSKKGKAILSDLIANRETFRLNINKLNKILKQGVDKGSIKDYSVIKKSDNTINLTVAKNQYIRSIAVEIVTNKR